MPRPASLSLTDERLRIERDGTGGEYAWRHVTKTTEAADCHLIWLRPSGTAITLPKRAIPPDLRLEVAEFLRQRGTAALGRGRRPAMAGPSPGGPGERGLGSGAGCDECF